MGYHLIFRISLTASGAYAVGDEGGRRDPAGRLQPSQGDSYLWCTTGGGGETGL